MSEAAEAVPHFGLNVQYVKDLSFEHPMAPRTFTLGEQPKVGVNVGTQAQRVSDVLFEVVLRILVEAKIGEEMCFVADLHYGGLFTLDNIPAEHVEPLLLVEAPRLLFPFARRVIADVTRDGGVPPLMMEPIDFLAQYQRGKALEGETSGEA